MFFAAQIMTQVIGFFLPSQFGSRCKHCAHGRSDMAAISHLDHHLVTRREPIASVAFCGKFWSMQNDCRRGPFGFFLGLAAFRFFKA
jgi:hypothetical protein